uniref:WW domain-containing protein n=1 Tax=Steinernema glaseri TaxID=37863 RepID=A0A1I7YVL2_9BILA
MCKKTTAYVAHLRNSEQFPRSWEENNNVLFNFYFFDARQKKTSKKDLLIQPRMSAKELQIKKGGDNRLTVASRE